MSAPAASSLRIGDVARLIGTTPRTIRYHDVLRKEIRARRARIAQLLADEVLANRRSAWGAGARETAGAAASRPTVRRR
jgi:hypothetical protein